MGLGSECRIGQGTCRKAGPCASLEPPGTRSNVKFDGSRAATGADTRAAEEPAAKHSVPCDKLLSASMRPGNGRRICHSEHCWMPTVRPPPTEHLQSLRSVGGVEAGSAGEYSGQKHPSGDSSTKQPAPGPCLSKDSLCLRHSVGTGAGDSVIGRDHPRAESPPPAEKHSPCRRQDGRGPPAPRIPLQIQGKCQSLAWGAPQDRSGVSMSSAGNACQVNRWNRVAGGFAIAVVPAVLAQRLSRRKYSRERVVRNKRAGGRPSVFSIHCFRQPVPGVAQRTPPGRPTARPCRNT